MPEKSTDQLVCDIQDAEKEIAEIESRLIDCKKYHDGIVALKDALASDIEFETVYSGMERDSVEPEENRAELDTVESALEKEKAESIAAANASSANSGVEAEGGKAEYEGGALSSAKKKRGSTLAGEGEQTFGKNGSLGG